MIKLTIQANYGTLDATKAAGPAWLAAIGDFNFLYASGVLFVISIAVVIGVSLLGKAQDEASIAGLTYSSIDKKAVRASIHPLDIAATAIILAALLGMYLYFSFWLR
jgi:SSS family solute:Na+ symporter